MAATELGDPCRMVLNHLEHGRHTRTRPATLAHRLWLVVQNIIYRLTCGIIGSKVRTSIRERHPLVEGSRSRAKVVCQTHVALTILAPTQAPAQALCPRRSWQGPLATSTNHHERPPKLMTPTPIPCSAAARKSSQGPHDTSRTHRLQGGARQHRGGTDDRRVREGP